MREKRPGDKSEASNFKEDLPILTGLAGVPYAELWHPYITDRDPIMDLTLASKIHRRTCKSTVFYRTPAPIIVYYFPYITCLLYLLFLIKHVRTSG